MASRFKKLLNKMRRPRRKASASGPSRLEQVEKTLQKLSKRLPKGMRGKKIDLETISAKSNWIRWGLAIFALYLLADIAARITGNFIKPSYQVPTTAASKKRRTRPTEDYSIIQQQNIFNVEGNIPAPWDTGMLNCLSQARASNRGITLLGTIVMKKERYSVALIQEAGKPHAIKKDEQFGEGRYTALEIQRQKLCFKVNSGGDLEYVEIKDNVPGLGVQPTLSTGGGTAGIKVTGQGNVEVSRGFLEDKIKNLHEILQTAKAIPNIDRGTGKFNGFLIQSIQQDSPFFDLGIRRGDVLTQVNDIVLDNAGKGLEAFRQLRNSDKVALEIIRGGQKQTLNFNVK